MLLPDDIICSTKDITPEAEQALAKYNHFMSKSRPVKAVVRRSHKFLDELMLALNVPQESPCKAACNACCTHGVEVTQVEAAMIQDVYQVQATGIKDGVVMPDKNPTNYEGLLCPFNKDGNCQIYEWRPVVCRVFFSMEKTNHQCYNEKGGLQFNHRSSDVIRDIVQMLMTGTNLKGGNDIRYFFGKEAIEVKHER